MALNNTDKAWITLEIQTALKRKGWGRLTGFMKDWSGTGAAVAILILAFAKWEGYVEFRTKTNDRLETIEKTLSQISASLELLKPRAGNTLPQAIKNNLSLERNSDLGLKTVAALATKAKEQNVTADPQQISALGIDLASESRLFKGPQVTDAWNALTGLLNYSSFLKMASFPAEEAQLLPQASAPIQYDFGGTEGKTLNVTVYSLGGMVPIAEAARAEHIVDPKRITATYAPKTVVVRGGLDQVVYLDLHRLKNIVYVNMTIEYHGGPVILENVSFINCVFRLVQQPQCIDFGKSVFASTTTTFTSGA
jgi:hypothetical protein